MFKKIILSITFSIGFMFACSEGDDFDNSQNDSFDRGNLQTNLADNIIIPAYQDLNQKLEPIGDLQKKTLLQILIKKT